MQKEKNIDINSLSDLEQFTHWFAQKLKQQNRYLIFLKGDLGSGKTTFTQKVLHKLGWPGRVKSPTYSLIEPYEIGVHKIYHLDLYRLQSGAELYDLGLQDIFTEKAWFFIEWPEHLQSLNLRPDIEIIFKLDADKPNARKLSLRFAHAIWDDIFLPE